MAKPDLGSKQKCQNCGTKFFDLNKTPITCPKCGTIVQAVSTTARAASRAAAPDDEETDGEAPTEIVSLEEADQAEDGKVAPTAIDDDVDVEEDDAATSDDDDTFLEEEEEDSGDVSDLIDGDIENDEER